MTKSRSALQLIGKIIAGIGIVTMNTYLGMKFLEWAGMRKPR